MARQLIQNEKHKKARIRAKKSRELILTGGSFAATQSKLHIRMVKIVVKRLTRLKFESIQLEARLPVPGIDIGYKSNKGVRPDILAFKGSQRVIVECGGSLEEKQRKMKKLLGTYAIYIWAYGEVKLFRWRGEKICTRCGHRV